MKRLFTYLIVAMLFASCGKKVEIIEPPFTFDDNLLLVDSLMQSDADTALRILLDKAVISTEAERSGEISFQFNVNYHSLLLSEALYKTDNAQYYRYVKTCHGASLQDAIHYFDSLAAQYPDNDDFIMLSARSRYMNGVGYYENDSVVDACKEYLHTLEIMEDHFEEKQLVDFKAKFMGLTYTRLGEVYCNHATAQASIDSYKNALYYFTKYNKISLANTYKSLGKSYWLTDNKDSSLYCFRQSINMAKKQNKIYEYGRALSEAAALYYDLGYKDSAFYMIRTAIDIPSGEDALLTRFFVYGSLLAQECRYDSAIYYLEKSINRNQFATKTVSAELLMKCYQALGDTVKMRFYKNIYGEELDEYREILTFENSLSSVYRSYMQDKIQTEQMKSIRNRNIKTIIILTVLITFIVGTIILVGTKMTKIKDDAEEKDKALAEMKRKMGANPFINEPICKYILNVVNENSFKAKVNFRIYEEFALNKNQIMMLKNAIDRHYDNFTQTLVKKYPELTVDDIDYCCLYLLGLKDADVSALMQRAYPTVYQRSKKLKRIFAITGSLQSAVTTMASQLHKNT